MIVDANDLGQEILGKSDDIELSEADLKKAVVYSEILGRRRGW